MMTAAKWKRAGRTDEVRGPGPHAIAAEHLDLVLIRTPAGPLAFEGRCPHRGALLGEGELVDGMLVCRNHRWRFDPQTGARLGGPECLRRCDVREEDGEIFVDVSSLDVPQEPSAAAVGPGSDGAPPRRIEDLPGPRILPLIGSRLTLDRLHLQIEEWAREFGMPYAFAVGPRTVVMFGDVHDIKPALRERPELFRRSSNLASVFREIGVDGVFSAEGAAWRPQRRLSMEALSHRHLKSFYPTLATVAERLRRRWERAAARGDVLDLPEELKRFTVDVTTQLVFGYDIDTLGKDDDVIQKKLGQLFPAFNRRLFSALPWWRWFKLPRDRRLDRAMVELRTWLDGLATEARARLQADPERAEHPANFLEAMLTARDEHGKPFDDRAIFGNAMTMLLAGEDTTAYTLAWCAHQLLESPADVDALRAELDEALGEARIPPDIDTANGLRYATAIANETMRLRPVAPLIFLEALHDTVVGGVALPRQSLLVLALRTPAVSAEHFGDPDAFRPARWLDQAATAGAHDPSAHQPFGSGPRICPGRTLALLEMRLVLATLYQNFDVERVGDARDVREVFSFTMMPAGLTVRLKQRVGRSAEVVGA